MREEHRGLSGPFICLLPILFVMFFPPAFPVFAEGWQQSVTEQAAEAGKPGRETFRQADPFQPPADFEGLPGNRSDGTGLSEPKKKTESDKGEKTGEKPRIAIIIDDMGNNRYLDEQLLSLDLHLTFAFLPYAPFTQVMEERAWMAGHDILVHMPMEPKDPQWDPGPDALHVNDSFEQLAAAVEKNLALVPHAIGVNNHMGSLFTEDRLAMHQFLDLIRQKGLFFIDSSTSAESIGMKEANEMGIKTARRHVFLDNILTEDDICGQLEELVRIARTRGWAIGIGHSSEETFNALSRCRETLGEHVNLVGIHELIR